METNFLEKAFIGTIMNDNKLLKDTFVKPDHFVGQVHKMIYQAMQRLGDKGQAADAMTVSMTLGMDVLQGIGGINYLSEMQILANADKFEQYEKTILEAYQKRKMKNVLANALEKDMDIDELMSKLGELETHSDSDRVTAYDIAVRMFDLPFEPQSQEKAISTGLQNLDGCIGGLQKSELIILAARPSVGKTALALNMAIGAVNDGAKAIIFSLEMNSKSLGNRLAAHVGLLNLTKLKNPYEYFTQKDKNNWQFVTAEMSNLDLVIFENPRQSVAEMRSKIRKEIRESEGKDVVVFIDYLQYIKPADERAAVYVQVSQISRDLKQIAREFNVPVVCLSQLNRSVEQRENKRPMMSDIRDSGAIEQDADVIGLLYREGYYKQRYAKEKAEDAAMEGNSKPTQLKPLLTDILEIDIAKNRQGATERIEVFYDLSRGKISYDPTRATGGGS